MVQFAQKPGRAFFSHPAWNPSPEAVRTRLLTGVSAVVGVGAASWAITHQREALMWLEILLVYVGLPLALLWAVVRVARYAWTGK